MGAILRGKELFILTKIHFVCDVFHIHFSFTTFYNWAMDTNEDIWKKKLTPEQYRVMREKGTETPFSGTYHNSHEKGTYVCAACGETLFSSDAKFDSGTGWPSFTEPANREHITLTEDTSHGMSRVEVQCKNCGAHLGHVFSDGPKEGGGKRYCINSVCLELKREEK